MFSTRLKQLRAGRGLTQRQLALELGVAPSTIGMWEQGGREPNYAVLQQIADYFAVSLDDLVGRDESQRKRPARDTGVAMDEFTYAMQSEAKDLTEMDKQILLSMAKQLKDARKRSNGESG